MAVRLSIVTDPLAPLLELDGVADACDRARDALAAVHRHPVNLRGWDKTATEASWRAGRSSAAIEGGSVELTRDGDFDDPILAGAMRVAQALDGEPLNQLVATWGRAPLQVLARLQLLAAADLTDDELQLGRPRSGSDVAERLDLLAQLLTGGTRVPAPLVAAVVHGEILALQPFGAGNGVVARAASRLTCAASGLDPHNLGVPEVTWFKRLTEYRDRSASFAAGDPHGIRDWVILSCDALESGASEAKSIADAARA